MTAFPKEEPRAVAVRRETNPARFLDLQRGFYRRDPHYVPPITAGEAWQIDRRKNPFFQHAEAEFWSAWQDGECVGRISAARDRLHDEFHGDRIGFFGHFEAASAAAAQALLQQAATWCRERGATALRGPVDLSTNYRCGLLVEGEPGTPVVMMPYNPPHYAGWIEQFGLQRTKDLLALKVDNSTIDLRRIDRLAEHLQRKSRAQLRRVDMRRFAAECEVLWDLYHRIWERNWGFVPMSRDEFLAQANDLKKVARPEFLLIASIDDRPVGFLVALPDVNIGARACRGRLLPFGWWKFLQAMRKVHLMRVITLGVLPEFRRQGLEMLLIHGVIKAGHALGYDQCEASWILEDNLDMLGPLQTIGHTAYRRYRIYERPLGG